jgi:hypothetical protein
VSKGMDIQIKYKEVDKKTEVQNLVCRAVNEAMNQNGKFRACIINQIMSVMDEKSFYNRIKSKEIERVIITKGNVEYRIYPNCMKPIEVSLQCFQENECTLLSLSKSELKQYIDILTKIHDQMD